MRCWGESAFGQTGSDPARDPTCSFGGKCTRTPALVLGPDGQPFSGADQISAGRAHTCVRRNAEVWCWGFNKLGVLGDGRWGGVQLAAKRVEGLPSAASQLFGGNWLQAVLDDTGVAHVWGFNGLGQLGEGSIDGLPCDGDLPCRTSPSRGLGELTGLQSLALTGATAYAVDAEGRVLGWGGVGDGGLGPQPGAAGDRPDCRHADYPLKVCNPTPAPIEGLPTP